MQEEHQSVADNQMATSGTQNTLLKDLMIPISIVIAGMFVGAGLYFGGSGNQPVTKTTPQEPQTLLDFAIAAGADEDEFEACFTGGDTLPKVQKDFENGVATGGRGTPWAVMVGPSGIKYPISGAVPQAAIEQMIQAALAEGAQPLPDTEENRLLEAVNPISDEDHVKGDRNAKVVIIEYSDFDCPFCTRFHATMNSIVNKYPDDQVAWVYRHFPIEQLHPQAKEVAVASECVAQVAGEEAFWRFTDSYLK